LLTILEASSTGKKTNPPSEIQISRGCHPCAVKKADKQWAYWNSALEAGSGGGERVGFKRVWKCISVRTCSKRGPLTFMKADGPSVRRIVPAAWKTFL
jgi:hypothetical protein